MSYFDELTDAMTWLGQQPNTVFLGQQVRYPGNALFKTLSGVPPEKCIEMPIAEDMQLGISIGMALAGKIPITIYPRMDFLICAMNQLVNHLDKYPVRVIIRVCVGSKTPLDPGPQHSGDYTEGLRRILSNIHVIELTEPNIILKSYQYAYGRLKNRQSRWDATVLVERGELYGMV